ncbi:transcriptional-regulating factor 1-like [Megalops cyprinoides]|uniref:transcriptional-regulating factor 1-like n=1 Tax=Megalops cyprinoides TaxID=118141 RepID=UPI00186436B8|nr:transcriptional-regulating factor 1-like [Megalops cyprinoides]
MVRTGTDPLAPPPPPPPPLLLSPPPTPHSLPPLSPPRHTPHLPPAQLTQPTQSLQASTPCSSAQLCPALQTFYPLQPQTQMQPAHCSSPTLTGKCPSLDWLQQSHDQTGGGGSSYPQIQDRDSNTTVIFTGDGEFSLQHTVPNQQDEFKTTDHYSLQTPLSSSSGQYPQSCVSFQPDCDPVTSTGPVSPWCKEAPERDSPLSYPPSLPPCSAPSMLHPQGDGFRPGEGRREYFGSQSTVGGAPRPTSTKNAPRTNYTGLPFYSILQADRTLEAIWPGMPSHYTPRPMLNPIRRGTGLYCNLLRSYLQPRGDLGNVWPEEDCLSLPCVNVGVDFQVEVPHMREDGAAESWLEDHPREELLWKPWEELGESAELQEQVENLLDLCSSSAIPGGGTNLELALHCLSRCQGNILATVEMLLFSTLSSSESYHYTGSDVWMQSERRLFHKAFATYSKDFALIQNMVKTKRVSQCVEFYYLCKKMPELQRKQWEREIGGVEERSSVMSSTVGPTDLYCCCYCHYNADPIMS